VSEKSGQKLGVCAVEKAFLLVDPLDGSKEFIQRNGEFTVNLALIHLGKPVAGVVYALALNALYFGARGQGVFRQDSNGTCPIGKQKNWSTDRLFE
jgi:3'(2'), 5'-bisphosphate nucleotidase